MALLDKANTSTYGNPEITKVNIGVGKNPGILISGHDLRDIQDLLEQTEGTGIDVYTHSEMLPAHYYPAFKKYKHFVGNYGSAWWKQTSDFETFNGVILFTTNCLVPPRSSALMPIGSIRPALPGSKDSHISPIVSPGALRILCVNRTRKEMRPSNGNRTWGNHRWIRS
mgnify:CR=1 FL=1